MKDELIILINSYSAAIKSGDPLLQEFATGQLKAFLDRVELIRIESPGDSSDE
jgi:hypothetical protein